MTAAYALVLLIAGLALALSIGVALRNPTESIRQMAREALERSTLTQTSNEAFKSEVTSILSAVQDERERTEKLRSRARAAQQRAEQADTSMNGPKSRDELLIEYRQKAGIL